MHSKYTNYQRGPITAERTALQIENIISFLGNDNIIALRTSGTAIREEVEEFSLFIRSLMETYEIEEPTYMRQLELVEPTNGIEIYQGDIASGIRYLASRSTSLDPKGIWIDMDFPGAAQTCSPTRQRHLGRALQELVKAYDDLPMVLNTTYCRRGRWKPDTDKSDQFFKSLCNYHHVESFTHRYSHWYGSMICHTYFYTPR